MKYALLIFIVTYTIHAHSDSFSETENVINLMNSTSDCPNGDYYKITSGALNIRNRPSGVVVGKYQKNDVICVLETEKGWANTFNKDNKNVQKGWVSKKYLKQILRPVKKKLKCDFPPKSIMYHACMKYNTEASNENKKRSQEEAALTIEALQKHITISDIKYQYDYYQDKDAITTPNYTTLQVSLEINNRLRFKTINAEVTIKGVTQKGSKCTLGCVFWGGKTIDETKSIKVKPGKETIRIYVDLQDEYTHVGLSSFLHITGNPGRVGSRLVGEKPEVSFQIVK